MKQNRRNFLGTMSSVFSASLVAAQSKVLPSNIQVACNQYNWIKFYGREGKTWFADPDTSLSDFVKTGIKGYEPAFNNADDAKKLAPFLKKYDLQMYSVYVNSVLHNAAESQKTIENVLAIADAVKPLGTKILVSNPSPLKWGSTENKNDEQLSTQAENLNKLGAELRKRGMILAYHNHDPELREAAREFHHMMLGTDAQNVKFCLDAHWCYRGSGNSQVALFDIVKLYGKRIVEVHLRQSKNGIWTEVFEDGDIDYRRLVKELKKLDIKPHLVLEQCIEKESTNTTNAIDAHRKGLAYTKQLFGV